MLQPLPEDIPDSFSVAGALAHGVARHRLRGEDLLRPHHGMRVMRRSEDIDPGVRDEWELRRADHLQRMREYLPVLNDGGFFCGPSAAVAWGIPLPPWIWPHDALHVGIHRPRRSPRRPGVVGHQFTRGFIHLDEAEGLPVTDAASTWASLGALLGLDDLVAAADRVLRTPRHPGGFRIVAGTALADRRELEELVERKGRPGAPRLREALGLARDGASSPPETQIRLILHRAGLPEPVLDFDVHDGHGRFLGCSELAYPDRRLAIEYESDGHLTRKQLQRDIDKYHDYAEAGWYAIRLTSEHVYRNPAETVRRVRGALERPSIWRKST